eukprot:scaffold338_cov377-Prasinococcus_capsulatus_cf.AAC.14
MRRVVSAVALGWRQREISATTSELPSDGANALYLSCARFHRRPPMYLRKPAVIFGNTQLQQSERPDGTATRPMQATYCDNDSSASFLDSLVAPATWGEPLAVSLSSFVRALSGAASPKRLNDRLKHKLSKLFTAFSFAAAPRGFDPDPLTRSVFQD